MARVQVDILTGDAYDARGLSSLIGELVMTRDERAFLHAQMHAPGDADLRLVYSDWLEERGDAESMAKAEFLRLTAGWMARGRGESVPVSRRLRELAATLDPEWLTVVSELKVEACDKGSKPSVRGARPEDFAFLCSKRWSQLQPTEDAAVRFCSECRRNVHYCAKIEEARDHAWQGHCVAVDLGVPRVPGDLDEEHDLLGELDEVDLDEFDE
jgi:uncharacterized protein (TIGR02996 family)